MLQISQITSADSFEVLSKASAELDESSLLLPSVIDLRAQTEPDRLFCILLNSANVQMDSSMYHIAIMLMLLINAHGGSGRSYAKGIVRNRRPLDTLGLLIFDKPLSLWQLLNSTTR